VETSRIRSEKPILRVRGLGKTFSSRRIFGARREVVAARDVSFTLSEGEAVALVGESGSGKSTIARLILRLEAADVGEITLDGMNVLAEEPRRASRGYRRRVQMVFQDPFGSLNPVHSVEHHLVRPLRIHEAKGGDTGVRRGKVRDYRSRAADLLAGVGLEPPEEFLDRHPYELSGGQRQRVAIARALAVDPDLLVADEPTSMLDVSIRMDILNVLARLKQERSLAILLITHDLASARYLADRVLVLFRGRIVEEGPSRELVESPKHPYTRALLDSIAEAGRETGPASAPRSGLSKDAASGCPFASRCPEVMDVCRTVEPGSSDLGNRHVRCHLYEDGAPAPGRSPDGEM
jgi:peptide/nickel transport system ATP-binding protein